MWRASACSAEIHLGIYVEHGLMQWQCSGLQYVLHFPFGSCFAPCMGHSFALLQAHRCAGSVLNRLSQRSSIPSGDWNAIRNNVHERMKYFI